MIRTIVVAVTVLVATFVCSTPIIVIGLFGRTSSPWIDRLVRIWARAIVRSAGIDLKAIEHPEIDENERFVFVANHHSYLDIPFLLAATTQPIRFMAKKSLFQIPIFGWGLKAAGFIPIDRKDTSTAVESFRLAAQRIRLGNSIVVFPEGGRSPGPDMNAFKKGAFLLAMKGSLDIIPVAIIGTREVMPVGRLIIRPGPVTIRAGRPIRISEYSLRRRPELMERTRQEIARMADLGHEMMTEEERVTLAHSPDADDAFMFYALARAKIDTNGFEFEHHLKDIQSLNVDSREGVWDVTALSFALYPEVADRYALLSSGASIGDGYGPIVVSSSPLDPSALKGKRVAVPGLDTSAYVSLKLFEPELETVVMGFDEVQHAVKRGDVDAGVIIHEGQLTYGEMGLHLVVDLGAWWKEETGLPLPLGCNAIRRSFGEEKMRKISRILKKSIEYSLENREAALDYALGFGRGLDRDKGDEFVGMYVNDLTVDYGDKGKEAVRVFLDRAHEAGLVKKIESYDFY